MEYPGRYSRWHMGYVDPCVEFAAFGRELTATALNERGAVLLPAIEAAFARAGRPAPVMGGARRVRVVIAEPTGTVPEEERSRRPTVFSAIREVIALFAGPDEHLGLFASSSRSGCGPAGTMPASVTAGSAISSCTCLTSCT